MADPAAAEGRLSKVFGALADPTRRDIVARLAVGDATVGQLGASMSRRVGSARAPKTFDNRQIGRAHV